MKCATRKLRSPVKWHGGKSYLCERIIDLFPEHDVYIEPFAGGLSTLLNKPRAAVEVVGDLNVDLIEMWRDIGDFPCAFAQSIAHVEYTEHFFNAAKNFDKNDPGQGAFESSVAFLVRNRMSRGGLGKTFAWSDRLRGGKPGDVNGWETFVRDHLPQVAERMKGVEIQRGDAISTIWDVMDKDSRHGQKVLIYADPPYLHETRTATKAYAHEMSKADHETLLSELYDAALHGAKVFLSAYPSSFYYHYLGDLGWMLHQWNMPNHSGQGKTKQPRIECLWESMPR